MSTKPTTVDAAREALLLGGGEAWRMRLDAFEAAVRAEYEGFIDEDDCAHSQKVALERQRAESAETLRALREAAADLLPLYDGSAIDRLRAALDATDAERSEDEHKHSATGPTSCYVCRSMDRPR